MNNIESTKGEIVMYQPDETIRLEVRVESETVWLSQAQMAELFGTKRPAITKHLNNIYKCEELLEESTCSILEHMGNDGSNRSERNGRERGTSLRISFMVIFIDDFNIMVKSEDRTCQQE